MIVTPPLIEAILVRHVRLALPQNTVVNPVSFKNQVSVKPVSFVVKDRAEMLLI